MKTNFDKEFEEFQNDNKEINESLEFEKEQYDYQCGCTPDV